MKRQQMQDERVLMQRRKINSEAYGILIIALLISILVQQFLLDAPLEQYAAETICLYGISFYVIIRYITLGLNIFGEGKRAKSMPLVNCIVIGITMTTISGILNYSTYAERFQEEGIGPFIGELAVSFISASGTAFIALSFIKYLNKKKQEKIQRQLDEDE